MKNVLAVCLCASLSLQTVAAHAQQDQRNTMPLRPVVGPRNKGTSAPNQRPHDPAGTGRTTPELRHHRGGYTLAELQQVAAANNPTLTEAHEQVAGQRATAEQAGLYPNPIAGYVAEQVGERNEHTANSAGETQGAFVRQEIVTAGKLRLSRDKYLARTASAEAGVAVQDYRVKNDVAIHYYRTLGTARHTQTERELLRTWEDNLVTQRERFNVGQANEADVHQATAQLQEQRLRLEMAQNEEQQTWQELLATAGTQLPEHGLADSLDSDDAPKLAYQPALDRVLAQSPELALARAQLRADEDIPPGAVWEAIRQGKYQRPDQSV
ncbi:MAG: TolC family protein [Rhodospirillales bacterium]|nr:TolC family protein [Acetobacter sp.]